MKTWFTSLVAIFVSAGAFAQLPCGTIMPPVVQNWIKAYKQLHPGAPAQRSLDSAGIVWIPLQVHSVGTDDGSGYYQVDDILDMLCNLNSQYLPIGWQFYLYGNIDYIASSELDTMGGNYQDIINSASLENVPNAFFVTNPLGYCGFFYYYGGPADNANISGTGYQGFVAINKTCAGEGNTTVAHELGHYFSMLHPFNGWEQRDAETDPPLITDEYVDETNCATAGDYLCDTRADYQNYRWDCPYYGTKTDYNGDVYDPDGSLFMGYSIEPCGTRFSPEQIDVMKAYMPSHRAYTTAISHPAFVNVTDTAEIIFPPNDLTGLSPDRLKLTWTAVPNATEYSVEINHTSEITDLDVDTIVSGTSMVVTNLPDNLYRWRVRAINPGYTCSPYTAFSYFTTDGTATGIDELSSVNNLNIFPDPVAGNQQLTVNFTAQTAFAGSIEVYDNIGQRVQVTAQNFSEGNNIFNITLNNPIPGIYVVRISSEDGASVNKKLVVY